MTDPSPPLDLSALARETADTLTRHMRGELVPEVRDLFAKVIKAALVRVQQGMNNTYPQPQNGWTCFHCGEVFTTPGGASDHFGATPEATAGCLIDRVALEEGGKPERGRGLLMALRKAEAEVARLRGQLEQAQQSLAAAEASEQSTREASMRWQMRAEQAERDLAQARQSLAGAASACATVVKVEVEACRVRVRRETLEDVKAGIEAAADRRPALMNPDTMRHIAAQIAIWADHQIDLRRLRDSSGEG